MNVLALDLSTKSTGFCVGKDGTIQDHGLVVATSRDVVKRIIKIRDRIQELVDEYDIDVMVMEEVRPEYNSHTNKVLMWLQAAVVIAAVEENDKVQYEFIGASQWRAALKMKQGRGVTRDQLKPQSINYVKDHYGWSVNDDEAEAICIFDAYCEEFDNEINWG